MRIRTAFAEQDRDQFVYADEPLTVTGELVTLDHTLHVACIGEVLRRLALTEQQRQILLEPGVGEQPGDQVVFGHRQHDVGDPEIDAAVILTGGLGALGGDTGAFLDPVQHRVQRVRIEDLDAQRGQRADAVERRTRDRVEAKFTQCGGRVAPLEFGEQGIQHIEQGPGALREHGAIRRSFDLRAHAGERRTLRGKLGGVLVAHPLAQLFRQLTADDERIRRVGRHIVQQTLLTRLRLPAAGKQNSRQGGDRHKTQKSRAHSHYSGMR